MKTHIKDSFLLSALTAGLGLMLAGRVTAQTFTRPPWWRWSTAGYNDANSDGAHPYAGLVLSGNTLYGTASGGGSSGLGTVFAVNTDGTGFTNLHSFTATSLPPLYYESDIDKREAGLILSGSTLYGTAERGGSSGYGTVFKLNMDGTGFTTLYNFTALSTPYGGRNSDGAGPNAGLILSGNTLYGTAERGGSSSWGTVVAINIDGAGFTNLHNFDEGSGGVLPCAGLILSGNTLYGTAARGGGSGYGTLFKVNTDGTGFTNLHNFTAIDGYGTNSDGVEPRGDLILSDNTLYGTTLYGGPLGNGTVFAVKTDGTGFTSLHSFTWSDGGSPYAGLLLSGNILYGTASRGGSSGQGTVFAVKTDGTGFRILHNFTADSGSYPYGNGDGTHPRAGLILSGNTLYGTASDGGSSGNGTVFAVNTDGTRFTILHTFTATPRYPWP